MAVRLLAPWIDELPLQMQAVLVLATRGCDGMPKDHGHKPLLYYYRAIVMAAAHLGRMLEIGEHVPSLMTLRGFDEDDQWDITLGKFMAVRDGLPLHFYTHFMHGCQIVAYKHPDHLTRTRFLDAYGQMTSEGLHASPESAQQMNHRLNDFGRALDQVIPYMTMEF